MSASMLFGKPNWGLGYGAQTLTCTGDFLTSRRHCLILVFSAFLRTYRRLFALVIYTTDPKLYIHLKIWETWTEERIQRKEKGSLRL